MVTEPLVDVVMAEAGRRRVPVELDYPHGQVRLLNAEPLLWPGAYYAVRADHGAFAAVRVNTGGALVWQPPGRPSSGVFHRMSEPA